LGIGTQEENDAAKPVRRVRIRQCAMKSRKESAMLIKHLGVGLFVNPIGQPAPYKIRHLCRRPGIVNASSDLHWITPRFRSIAANGLWHAFVAVWRREKNLVLTPK
jgi:hypothetical protein